MFLLGEEVRAVESLAALEVIEDRVLLTDEPKRAKKRRGGIALGNQWSENFDLLTSIGSDFHGWPNQRVQIGNLADLPSTNRAIWSYL